MQYLTRFFISSFLLLALSCQVKSVSEQTIRLPYLTAKAPESWKIVQLKGIDSDIQAIITDTKDTLFLDYGPYSMPFDQTIQVRSFERKRLYDSAQFHYPSNMVFSKTAEIDEAQAIYLKEYFLYDTINSRRAKVVLPKLIGQGHTAIHFPEVDKKGNKLTIQGQNLDTLQQFATYKMFKSIRFY